MVWCTMWHSPLPTRAIQELAPQGLVLAWLPRSHGSTLQNSHPCLPPQLGTSPPACMWLDYTCTDAGHVHRHIRHRTSQHTFPTRDHKASRGKGMHWEGARHGTHPECLRFQMHWCSSPPAVASHHAENVPRMYQYARTASIPVARMDSFYCTAQRKLPPVSLPGLDWGHMGCGREEADQGGSILAHGARKNRLTTTLQQQQLVKGLHQQRKDISTWCTCSKIRYAS